MSSNYKQTSGLKLRPKPMESPDEKDLTAKSRVSLRSLAGTPMYLSPEQKELRQGSLNMKSTRAQDLVKLQQDKVDIYAAGIVLFEMCGNFRTDMERYTAMDNLEKRR